MDQNIFNRYLILFLINLFTSTKVIIQQGLDLILPQALKILNIVRFMLQSFQIFPWVAENCCELGATSNINDKFIFEAVHKERCIV